MKDGGQGPGYRRILVGIDGSEYSSHAAAATLSLAAAFHAEVIGCHVYAARLHESRFSEMEPGLPGEYQEPDRLKSLQKTHDTLISKGMKLISDAYLSPYARQASDLGIAWDSATPEGRNYVEMLKLIRKRNPDLVALGACGLGRIPDVPGSLTVRTVLGYSGCDFLIMKAPFSLEGRPVVVGVDGSPESHQALLRTVTMAGMFGTEVRAVAAYDPHFHAGVFRTISASLPEKLRSEFDFAAQEQLHDGIINNGLRELYGNAVERSAEEARKKGVFVQTEVIAGKPHEALRRYAEACDAALLVVGRYGLHRDAESLLGSTGFSLLLRGTTNLLIVSGAAELPPNKAEHGTEMIWAREAEEILAGIPQFARPLARNAVEREARTRGLRAVNPDLVRECAERMGRRLPSGQDPGQVTARFVKFRKLKRFAPEFHRHILKGRILGRVVSNGDRILVYEVVETVPPGPVKVTDETVLEFR
ncbi:MAG: universal stress protein [Methanoregulaceae archaeon]|nr:universal stress protein [Methanoregulaceae archaeon]